MTGRPGSGSAREAGQTNPRSAGPDDAGADDAVRSSAVVKEVQPGSASKALVAAAARGDLTPPASRHRDDGAGEGEHLLAGAGDGQVDAEPAVLEHGADL